MRHIGTTIYIHNSLKQKTDLKNMLLPFFSCSAHFSLDMLAAQDVSAVTIFCHIISFNRCLLSATVEQNYVPSCSENPIRGHLCALGYPGVLA